MAFRRGLFDTGLNRPPPPPSGNDPKTGRPKAWTVTSLTKHIKDCIERGFGTIWVEGELSNFKGYASGHLYFTLKDESAQLSAVMWRSAAERLKFMPQDGQKVLVSGRLSVYEPRGQYQMIVERMEPLGVGDLAAAFEQLKKKLSAEGLFEPTRKRPLPPFPRRIGIVTSRTGAAIQDLLKVIFARWPADLILAPVRVQGEGAAHEIVAAISLFNRLAVPERPDVLIVGRGGGSMEDLWAFNEEPVARAIYDSQIPVISAVGHEIDFTIADFVADVRAATPSHAGEMVVPKLDDIIERLDALRAALPVALLRRVELARERLNSLEQSYALRHPEQRVAMMRQRLDDLSSRLQPAGQRCLQAAREQAANLAGRLDSLSPLKVLVRGYSVTLRESDQKVVRSIEDVRKGDRLRTRLGDGSIISEVRETKKQDRSGKAE
ncbi:MAG TPA: exodeoxyribonuclease VII large subunit [Planctomycetota bacterium]|nr:exodeoxyribonuclease VII large subunit [Planctomycetota bacterium]